MLKVLLISLENKLGGAEQSLLLLAKGLKERVQLVVACPGPGGLTRHLEREGIDWLELPTTPHTRLGSWRSWRYWIRVIRANLRMIKHIHPHVVHYNSYYAIPIALSARLFTRIPLVMHMRDFGCTGWLARLLKRACSRIIAVSQAVKMALVEAGVPAERIEVVHNGVACREDVCVPTPAQTDTREHPFVFGHVGQFVPWKRQSDFITVAQQVGAELRHVCFHIIGDDLWQRNPVYTQTLVSQAREVQQDVDLRLMGWQSDMTSIWQSMDCLVHTAWEEPFGRIIIEAMAHGVPVIAMNASGPTEIIEHGRTGLLVTPGDLTTLKKAMVHIAQDSDLRQHIVTSAYEHVRRYFDASDTSHAVHQIYKGLVDKHAHWV